jgi:hypothetical protein
MWFAAAVVGLVFLAAVIFHLTMEQPQRRVNFLRAFGIKPGN